MLVQAYRASYDFPAIVTRGSNTYGWYQYPEKIIPLFITNAVDDRRLPIYGDGGAGEGLHLRRGPLPGDRPGPAPGCAGRGLQHRGRQRDQRATVADAVLRLLEKPSELKQFVTDRPGHDRRTLWTRRSSEPSGGSLVSTSTRGWS